mgnify:CR=1 FL=1
MLLRNTTFCSFRRQLEGAPLYCWTAVDAISPDMFAGFMQTRVYLPSIASQTQSLGLPCARSALLGRHKETAVFAQKLSQVQSTMQPSVVLVKAAAGLPSLCVFVSLCPCLRLSLLL